MSEKHQSLFDESLLLAHWGREFEEYKGSEKDAALARRLKNWAQKDFQKETTAAGTFVSVFFEDVWGYVPSGRQEAGKGYSCFSEKDVKKAGETGGTGSADLACGWFGRGAEGIPETPQVLCEFKDIRSGLDSPQHRKGSNRSPVEQCAAYLKYAFDTVHPSASIKPAWGIVTDMNEFRLYFRAKMPAQYQRFILCRPKSESEIGASALIDETDDAVFQRFLFQKLFQAEMLLSTGGPGALERLLAEQVVHEKNIENEFYREYRTFRERVYHALVEYNPGFTGTRGTLVRLAQRFLDRCIFILFCEDMGASLHYPPNLLRDLLIDQSKSKFYKPEGDQIWGLVKELFDSMREGSPFYEHKINRFNGGLFETYPELESLTIPNSLFCMKGQGESDSTIQAHPATLLYLTANYNFGVKTVQGQRSIDLYTLGRIFEQSITELEFLEAEAENRESIAGLSKRKRDGVYYTPEWVTHYIVEETVGARLKDLRDEIGLSSMPEITPDDIEKRRAFEKDKRKTAPIHVRDYLNLLEKYSKELDEIKVVDPACGSGAFLIQAFNRLLEERQWIAGERERITGNLGLFDIEELMRATLSKNIYGVDINPESVEITRLALWLRTALPDRPLTALEDNIQCGNSLIDPKIYDEYGEEKQKELFPGPKRERINAFDWEQGFPEVFDKRGGFDCVIGNPPYVKLQHFRKIQPEVAEYLVNARTRDEKGKERPLYESTQTGNFDLYLPFIEKGIDLLNPKGRMGYIAPNVWMVNEYGKGLRKKIKRQQALDRWIDFKSFQVFNEAITYTAIQFFSGSEKRCIRCVFAPSGKEEIAGVNWAKVEDSVSFKDLPDDVSWNLMPALEHQLLKKLIRECLALGDGSLTQQIYQGVKTSGDTLYIAQELTPGRYAFSYNNDNIIEREIEQVLMFPVLSGAETKRYEQPETNKCILVPYKVDENDVRAFYKEEIKKQHPKCWAYLNERKAEFEARERGRMVGHPQWWSYIYPKNLRQMRLPKLLVAGTAPELRVASDPDGKFTFMGGRVYGILPKRKDELFFLSGILNSKTANFFFTRIARPKAGGYYDIETQFLAPLPIPKATAEHKKQVGERAKNLQTLYTERRDKLLLLENRLAALDGKPGKEYTKQIAPDLLVLKEMLPAGSVLSAENEYGELRMRANGVPVIEKVYVDAEDADLLLAQWRQVARTTNITEKFNPKSLVSALQGASTTDNRALKKQVVALDGEILDLENRIDRAEGDMNELVYGLYGLTVEERRMVEQG